MSAVWFLFVSLSGIAGLLFLKSFERRRGVTLFADARAKADSFVVETAQKAAVHIPRLFWQSVHGARAWAEHHGGALLENLAHFAERKLLRFVNMVKGRREVSKRNGTASAYLKDVVEHRDGLRNGNGTTSSPHSPQEQPPA